MSLLSIEAIDVYYGDLQALREISLSVEKGQVVAVLGPNGAGKSTLLRTISGIIRHRVGRIQLEGQTLEGIPPHKVADIGIAHVPEGRRIFADLTVKENLLIGGYRAAARKVRDQTLATVYELFPRLRERHGQLGGTLSGGEQQMLAIGRALMQKPTLLMLDEPSLGLAPAIITEVYGRLADIKAMGVSVLLVEQQAAQALRLADHCYILATGSVVTSGPPAQVANEDAIREAYLGL
jgi:branched-chain amino acid transport system ATP-binding protein